MHDCSGLSLHLKSILHPWTWVKIRWALGPIILKIWWGPQNVKIKGHKWPLKMLAHFNTWNQVWSWKKFGGPSHLLIPGAQMTLEISGLFDPCPKKIYSNSSTGKFGPSHLLIPGAQMSPEISGLFDPCSRKIYCKSSTGEFLNRLKRWMTQFEMTFTLVQ